MEVSYKKNLGRSYMCIEEQGQPLEPHELHMLENCSIPGFLQLQTNIYEGKHRYLYDISGKQQLEDYFAGKKVGNEMLQQFLFSVYKVCTDLPEYLLREEGLCLELRFIYVNLENGSLKFTYLPFYDKNLAEAFESCIEQLLRKLDHQDKAAVELGYRVYQLCSGGNANIGQVLKAVLGEKLYLQEEASLEAQANSAYENSRKADESIGIEESEQGKKRDGMKNLHESAWRQQVKSCKVQSKGVFREFLPDFWKAFARLVGKAGVNYHIMAEKKPALKFVNMPKREKKERFVNMPKREKKERFVDMSQREKEERLVNMPQREKEVNSLDLSENREETGIGQTEEMPLHATEILAVQFPKPMGKLVYRGNHSCGDIQVEGEEFLVGKNSEQVSGVISAEGVSRLHARITFRDDRYFIEDLNSTNGTYLNDTALEYHQPCELKINDRIRFAAEEYMFE